ncbi:polysaccharide export protein, partial [sediment metagenome]
MFEVEFFARAVDDRLDGGVEAPQIGSPQGPDLLDFHSGSAMGAAGFAGTGASGLAGWLEKVARPVRIKRSKRDWRGWRFYSREDIEDIRKFYESPYEYSVEERTAVSLVKQTIAVILAAATVLSAFALPFEAFAAQGGTVDIVLDELPVVTPPSGTFSEPIKYTLGPNDVIAIEVRRHPEFSGQYTVNSEGKIEYKFVGDIIVAGLTKNELKDRLSEILSDYLIEPMINVQIVAYLSKVFYVVGDVRNPGKFYMRGDTITIREALMQAGLPTDAAATRKCRLITPDPKNKNEYVYVNVFSLLYEGNLK